MMSAPVEKEYGTWESPLTREIACGTSISLVHMYCDPYDKDNLYWSELRPNEDGRTILFSKNVTSDVSDIPVRWTPDENFDVHDMVHEYGGAAYFVNNGVAYCANKKDNQIYSQTKDDKSLVLVTKQHESLFRYADGEFSKSNEFFFAVREQHFEDDLPGKVINLLAAVNVKTKEEVTLTVEGKDFYSSPRVSPDGKKLAFITWAHPNMPWDDTQLWVCHFNVHDNKMKFSTPKLLCEEKDVNFMEPRWTSDGKLLIICDKENWWNLYSVDIHTCTLTICRQDLEHELGRPCWQFGNRSYDTNPTNQDEVATLYGGKPALLNLSTGDFIHLDMKSTDPNQTCKHCIYTPDGQYLFLQAVSPTEREKIIRINMKTKEVDDFHRSSNEVITTDILSTPQPFPFTIKPKEESDIKTAYAYYYPPKNSGFVGLPNTLPPVLLKIHGGPTASASMAMDLNKQYFTSRGIGILDVNYRGSTGYGTAYRKELKGNWGVFDIEDCLAAAMALVDQGLADREKLFISGGSSGGYTTLACLTFDTNTKRVFKAGTSYYGISNLETLTQGTHKFESHYCDVMIAPYPERKQTYLHRSPGYEKNCSNFKSPCCFFQGALDNVVPPDQSEAMYNILLNCNKVTCSYNLFDDEYHGFNKAKNRITALGGEYYFYLKVLNLELSNEEMDAIKIRIDNLPVEAN